jgi:hypothetical protein
MRRGFLCACNVLLRSILPYYYYDYSILLSLHSLIAREDEDIAIIAIINSTMYARCLHICNVNASLRPKVIKP